MDGDGREASRDRAIGVTLLLVVLRLQVTV